MQHRDREKQRASQEYQAHCAPNPKEKQGTSPAKSPILFRREIPMAWGTTTDIFDSRNQSFPICNRNKMSNTKGLDLVPYSGRLK